MTVGVRPIPIRTRWINARSERDFAAADLCCAQLLERLPNDEIALRSTARLYDQQGREPAARPMWERLRDLNANDFEAAFHIARADMEAGMTAGEAARSAAPQANDTFRNAIVDALAHPAKAIKGDYRHIAICGVAYCGSTLLDRVIGGLPGVKSTGESHWITKVRAANRYADVDMSVPVCEQKFVPCTVCGHLCEVLTPEFRRSLAADSRDWYRKIAYQAGTRIIVSADKNVPKLVDKDPLLELSALIVFKSPAQAWRSQLNKLPKDEAAEYYEDQCRRYVTVWTRAYRGYLDHFRPAGPVAYINFDAFTARPERVLRAACDALSLPFDAEVLRRTVPGHAIGGNGAAMRRLRDKDYGVVIEPLPDPDLDPVHADILAADAEMQQTWQDLMERHDALMAISEPPAAVEQRQLKAL